MKYAPVFCLLGILAGCGNDSAAPTAGEPPTPTSASTSKPDRLSLPIEGPWSVTVRESESAGDRKIAAISHDSSYLAVWGIDASDRNHRQLHRVEVGFHPDGVRWLEYAGVLETLVVTVEGEQQVQLWQFADEDPVLVLTLPVQDPPQTVTVADLDGSGRADLILGPYQGNRLTLLWQEEDHGFTPAFLPAGVNPVYPAVVDWDGDGSPDIVWSDWPAGTLHWARNLGGRDFEVQLLHPALPGVPRQVIAGDIDGDGHFDLVVVLETGGSALVLYGDGEGGIAWQERIPAPGMGYVTAAVRGTGDSVELVLAEINGLVLARRTGDSDWMLRRLPVQVALPQDLQYTDVDLDGEVDIVFADSAGDSVGVVFGP